MKNGSVWEMCDPAGTKGPRAYLSDFNKSALWYDSAPMQMHLAFAYNLISPTGLCKEASEDLIHPKLILLTVDGEFCHLAAAAIADGVAGQAAVGASVLLLHRADDQGWVVFREVVSGAGAQRHAVSQPLKCDPCSSFHSAGPGHVCLVFHHGVRRAPRNHWDGHGDWGKTEEALGNGPGCGTAGQVGEEHSPSTVTCTVLSSLKTRPVLLWNSMLRFRW